MNIISPSEVDYFTLRKIDLRIKIQKYLDKKQKKSHSRFHKNDFLKISYEVDL